MADSLKRTRTEENLLATFAGESQTRNRYTCFANISIETAENEKEHASLFFSHLEGGNAEITAAYHAGVLKDSRCNLEMAADGEKLEFRPHCRG